jgi:diguanylate cyclase (GGDEF)-like protein
MPGISGFAACALLKAEPLTADVPIIFVTGAAETATKVKAFDLGAADYVTKPFEPAELRARVRAALRTKRLQDLLALTANTDALTGLKNRAHFERRIEEEMTASRRYGRRVALILFDLDHFKSINDTFGHPAGDRVLQRVGEVVAASVREADAPCRYGGEEFAVILPETGLVEAFVVVQRMQARIRELTFPQPEIHVTASFGVTSSERPAGTAGATTEQLIEAADRALYAAKNGGRDRMCSLPDTSVAVELT